MGHYLFKIALWCFFANSTPPPPLYQRISLCLQRRPYAGSHTGTHPFLKLMVHVILSSLGPSMQNHTGFFFIPGQLFCLQARPIVTLPPSCFFDYSAIGPTSTLFDNSNIVESYSGVTSPLTFSFASYIYGMVGSILMAAGFF